MALPKVQHPKHKLTIPSTGEKIFVRPFTGREEKILLIAQASGEAENIAEAIKDIVQNCVTSKVDVSKLAFFDIEYLFIKLRAFSVNNLIELEVHDEDDNQTYEIEVDLNQVEVQFTEGHTNKIQLTDEVGVIMKYPDDRLMSEIRKRFMALEEEQTEEAVKLLFSIFGRAVDKVWDDEKVYTAGEDFTAEEIDEFMDNLPSASLQKVQEFFITQPSLTHTVKYTNSLGQEKPVTLTGMADFFR